jgi:hypothetical protein
MARRRSRTIEHGGVFDALAGQRLQDRLEDRGH